MNPVSEEVGQTARTTIDALRTTPVLLIILLFNVVFMGFSAWQNHTNGARFERMMEVALQYCPEKPK